MNHIIDLEKVYSISDDFVHREIEGELVIVPISGGVGDLEDGLFSMNDAGKAIWNLIDGRTKGTLILQQLHDSFSAPENVIREDVIGFLTELLKRGMIFELK